MEYSFSNNFHQEQGRGEQPELDSLSAREYFNDGHETQGREARGGKDQRKHKEILARDIKFMLTKYLRDTKERYLRDFESFFDELSGQIDRYSLSHDLASLIEAKYAQSDPLNLIPLIKFQFSSLLPEITDSISIFTSSLRNSITLNLSGKGTFKYEKRVVDVPINFRGDSFIGSPRVEKGGEYQSRACSGSARKHNQLGFGQIQTSHFGQVNTPKKPYGTSQAEHSRPTSRQGLRDYKSPFIQPNPSHPQPHNQIEQTLARLNVDRETRQKIQSVVSQHKHYNTNNKENQWLDYQYKSPGHSEYLIHDPRGYTYQFSKSTRQ